MAASIDRTELLSQWTRQQLGQPDVLITPQAADASFRQYHRVRQGGRSLMLMDAPPERESVQPFLAIQQLLQQHGVRVPGVIASDVGHGLVLLEDFGDVLLSGVIRADNVDALYGQAINQMLDFQLIPLDALTQLPHYDESMLLSEMRLLDQWFLPQVLQRDLTHDEQALLQQVYQSLLSSLAQQPVGLVHRDFHSRNLMCLRDETALGVLDFQDAVVGPITYDLVSLLRDAYLQWPAGQVQQWLRLYWQRAQIRGLLPNTPLPVLQRWFDEMGLQRHLKILGIFVRLWQRDGKTGYLKDLPLVMTYTLQEAEALPELGLAPWLRDVVMPAFAQQHPRWLQQAGVSAT